MTTVVEGLPPRVDPNTPWEEDPRNLLHQYTLSKRALQSANAGNSQAVSNTEESANV